MKIAVLVSGGVDSAVALALLQQQGHEVTPFYLKIWLEDELSFLGECPWGDDLEQAKAVCDQLGLVLQVISLQKEYKEKIIQYMIDEIRMGRTPNPDILCNTHIKFGAFLEKVGESFDKVATGHYAGLCEKNGIFFLKQTPDPIKDQTYFLSRLSQKQLAQSCFPLADFKKNEVRALAKKFDLPNKDRKDSQGLCFLGKIKFRDFVKAHVGIKLGSLIEYETRSVLGTHEGFWFYTIGQRQGLGLSGGPWYVVDKKPETNTVFISKNYHDEKKERDVFIISDLMGDIKKYIDKPLQVKIRHGQEKYDVILEETEDDHSLLIKISQRDQGIAPGQFAVFYDDSLCVGSGVILRML